TSNRTEHGTPPQKVRRSHEGDLISVWKGDRSEPTTLRATARRCLDPFQIGHPPRDGTNLTNARGSRRGRAQRIRRWSPDVADNRLEVLHDCSEVELVACTGETPQPHALKAMMGL